MLPTTLSMGKLWHGRSKLDSRSIRSVWSALNQLDQYAVGALRMEERDQLLMGVPVRLLVDQLDALRLEPIQLRLDVVRFQGDVVDSGPPLADELRHLPFIGGGLQQLQAGAFALEGNEREKQLAEIFLPGTGQGEVLLEELLRAFEVFDRYSDMTDFLDH